MPKIDVRGNFDPQEIAQKLSDAEYSGQLYRVNGKLNALDQQKKGLDKLTSTLERFHKAVKSFKNTDGSLVQKKATVDKEGYVNVSINKNASNTLKNGTYKFFVEQLSSSHQVALDGLSAETLQQSGGTISLEQDGKQFSIDIAQGSSISDIVNEINHHSDNKGITASYIEDSNGKLSLYLNSKQSGTANKIQITASGSLSGSVREITQAKDTIVWLGGKGGVKLTSPTNTFSEGQWGNQNNQFSGLSMTFLKVHQSGEQPVTVDVGVDSKLSKDKVKDFVNEFNRFWDSLDELTERGGDGKKAGPFAGDSSILGLRRNVWSQLWNNLNSSSQKDSVGVLASYGLVMNRQNRLEINETQLDKTLKERPEEFNALIHDFLAEKYDKILETTRKDDKGLLKSRNEFIQSQTKMLNTRLSMIEMRQKNTYNRYYKQFVGVQKMMNMMQGSLSSFESILGNLLDIKK